MKKRNLLFAVIFSTLFFMLSCSDPLEEIQTNTEQVQEKGISPTKQYFHGTTKFRGFNINPWTYNQKLDEIVETTGANILRLSFTGGAKLIKKTTEAGVDYEIAGPSAFYTTNEVGFEALHRILDWAAARKDVKILINPHTVPGFRSDFTTDSNDKFWHNPLWKNHLIRLWDEIIDQVNSRDDVGYDPVAGYDLLNEPMIPGSCAQGNQWNSLVATLVSNIRAKGDMHPIIVETARIRVGQGCNGDTSNSANVIQDVAALNHLVLPNDNNLVVSPHFYIPHSFTHQGVNANPIKVRYPGTVDGVTWNKTKMNSELMVLQNYNAAPILIGEFSVSRAAGSDGDVFLNDFLEMAENKGWHWAYQAWDRNSNEWNPILPYTDTHPPTNASPLGGESINNAPRINLLRQYMYKNYSTYPPSDNMIYGIYRVLRPGSGGVLLTYFHPEVSDAFFNFNYKIDGVFGRVARDSNPLVVPVYKLRHPTSNDRLFTTSLTEYNSDHASYGYIKEGIGFYAAASKTNSDYIPVYRLVRAGYHRYAFGETELALMLPGWTLELNRQPAFYCRPSKF